MRRRNKTPDKTKIAQAHKPSKFGRRHVLAVAGLVLAGIIGFSWTSGLLGTGAVQAQELKVYKSPWCGCCGKWVDHVRAGGFAVKVEEVEDVDPIKARLGVPEELASCHTAEVDGYVVEGHVPVTDIRRLLAERPDARGLAVPGMPMGSPGMEGDVKEPYNVLIFDADGSVEIYSKR